MERRTMENPDFLIRSRQEIIVVLKSVMTQGTALSVSYLNVDRAVVSAIVNVDEPGNRLLLECPPNGRGIILNGGGSSVMAACAYRGTSIQFQTGKGEVVDSNGVSLLSLNIPDFMWRFQRRRVKRHSVSVLKIILNLGVLGCDAEVSDLGLGGIGMVKLDSDVKLERGEMLHDCTIVLPGVGHIPVDLKVQHQEPVETTDGSTVTRVGCQFSKLSDVSKQMISHYLAGLAPDERREQS